MISLWMALIVTIAAAMVAHAMLYGGEELAHPVAIKYWFSYHEKTADPEHMPWMVDGSNFKAIALRKYRKAIKRGYVVEEISLDMRLILEDKERR